MSSRRIHSTVNNRYIQPLKLRLSSLVLTPAVDYNSVLLKKTHRAFDPTGLRVKVWAKFNAESFDGIHLVATLVKLNERAATSASCTFKVYYVSANQNWTETLLYTGPATLVSGNWVLPVSQANLGALTEVTGERTFKIEATVARQGKTYKSSAYVNHLGIYDSLFRLKQEVDFLAITKKDE